MAIHVEIAYDSCSRKVRLDDADAGTWRHLCHSVEEVSALQSYQVNYEDEDGDVRMLTEATFEDMFWIAAGSASTMRLVVQRKPGALLPDPSVLFSCDRHGARGDDDLKPRSTATRAPCGDALAERSRTASSAGRIVCCRGRKSKVDDDPSRHPLSFVPTVWRAVAVALLLLNAAKRLMS
eukprot:CAMPEP_0179334988 /NCGR_PEP_ID=MMETSP0797-20121207/66241_1 /TAXON_ID=47934 /ORGANISM="Dinophysis acuminata, Strain DAEP01" /LENGTH=179 /DNA_ID=CAMNT_0021048321 /DNA_START=19 /DNA_END=558 /DNA_ORIENTATION=-